jgi:hypothetical protein
MNASGALDPCKSNGPQFFGTGVSGERVSNTLVTYP